MSLAHHHGEGHVGRKRDGIVRGDRQAIARQDDHGDRPYVEPSFLVADGIAEAVGARFPRIPTQMPFRAVCMRWGCRPSCMDDLVVKYQAIDIIDLFLSLIRRKTSRKHRVDQGNRALICSDYLRVISLPLNSMESGLFLHPDQQHQLKSNLSAYTVGSLRANVQVECLVDVISDVVSSDDPQEQRKRFSNALHAVFAFGSSKRQRQRATPLMARTGLLACGRPLKQAVALSKGEGAQPTLEVNLRHLLQNLSLRALSRRLVALGTPASRPRQHGRGGGVPA